MTRCIQILALLHVALVALAATNFSIVSWAWGRHVWQCNYLAFRYSNGWGYSYISDYSLAQVLAYLAGYGLGLPVFGALARRRGWLAGFGRLLCAAGGASFALELTHWFIDHHLSLIASFPAILAAVWVALGFVSWRERMQAGPSRAVLSDADRSDRSAQTL